VARAYAGLLAYKDEYEVARLHLDPAVLRRLEETFEPGFRLRFNLAPPVLSRPDPRTGRAAKREFGRWMVPVFRLLAGLKGLRGTAFDPFGRTEERRVERQLIADYEALMTRILPMLTADTLPLAVELAALPAMVRGFGHVKLGNVEAMKARREELLARFDGAGEAAAAAARAG
jgi:indolepyruvate ferredoxin oxidoreductase